MTLTYTYALSQIGPTERKTGTYKMILLKTVGTTPNNPDNPDIHTLEELLALTGTAEFNDTNYTPGFGGSGRKAVTFAGGQSSSLTVNDTNDRTEWDFDDILWASLGGTQYARAAVLCYYPGTPVDDGDVIVDTYFDIADTLTNGADFTLQVGANGAIHTTGIPVE